MAELLASLSFTLPYVLSKGLQARCPPPHLQTPMCFGRLSTLVNITLRVMLPFQTLTIGYMFMLSNCQHPHRPTCRLLASYIPATAAVQSLLLSGADEQATSEP